MIQTLTKVFIETKHTKKIKEELLNKIIQLNNRYNRHTIICEGYIDNVRLLSGIYHIDKKTKIKIYKGNVGLSLDIMADNAIVYQIFDHFWLTKKYKNTKKFMGFNKSIMLHGPAGTGKSTLCKLAAQKIAMRNKNKINIIELQCTQYVSKFYGESSQKLNDFFVKIDKNSIVIIDEIESLLISRNRITEKNEPLDSIRIVNTFLVNLDKSKGFFLFTTNFVDIIDKAFIDRMDMTIGLCYPPLSVVYRIMVSILQGLMLKNVLDYTSIPSYDSEKNRNNVIMTVCKLLEVKSIRKIKKTVFASLERNIRDVNQLLERMQDILLNEKQSK